MSLSKLVHGAHFRTYEEIEPLLLDHAKKQHVPYSLYSSRLVESYNAKENKCLPNHLKYQSFTYACKHYGTPRKNSKGIRPNQSSFKKDCKAHVRVTTNETTNRLEVSKITTIHNHELDPVLAPCYPENRRLDESEGENAMKLMEMEVQPAILQNIIRISTLKNCTLQDLRNLRQRELKKSGQVAGTGSKSSNTDVDQLLQELEDMKRNDPDAKLSIAEQDGQIMYIFWASSEMQADYRQYPEIIGLDNTYNKNNSKMPLGVFMCHDKNGRGKVVGYILLRCEKKEILHAAFTEFASCYSADIHRTKTVFVDKSMNEILRLWEVMPNVIIILCRFHCVNIFNDNCKSEPEKEKLRKYTKEMLYCETEEQYNTYYVKLCQVSSPTFKTYFDNNWHKSSVVWKGYERLEHVTLGVTTTNHNESWHGKLKKLLNRKRTIADMFRKLRVFHNNSLHISIYQDFVNTAKVHYVANNEDPNVAEITRVCTRYVSSLIRKQYDVGTRMSALPYNYELNAQKCACTFFKSFNFPCAHMFFSRRMLGLDLFSISDIAPKWRVINDISNDTDEIMEDLIQCDNHLPPSPVVVPTNPVKVGGRTLNSREKYNKFISLCETAGSVASSDGGDAFRSKCQVIEDIVNLWQNNQEVAVMPLARHNDQSTTTSVVTAVAVIQPRASVIVSQSGVANSGTQYYCRCGLEATRYIPDIGQNAGRVCYRCPKKLPDIPCLFSVVEKPGVEKDPGYSSDLRAGFTVHNIGVNQEDRPPALSLPPKQVVKGQPRSGNQRTFGKKNRKKTEEVLEEAQLRRQAKAKTIVNVTKISDTEWNVQSQTNDSYYSVRKHANSSTNCICTGLCTHCFKCSCIDFRLRHYPCKHIERVFSGIRANDYDNLIVSADNTDLFSDPDNEGLQDVKPIISQIPIEDPDLIITISDSDSEEDSVIPAQSKEKPGAPLIGCCVCEKIVTKADIKCIKCNKHMHDILPCSLDNMCIHCCDYSFEEYYGHPRQPGQRKKGPPYFCFGCNLIMNMNVAKNPKDASRRGDYFYGCARNASQICKPMSFWASKKGPNDTPSPKSNGRSPYSKRNANMDAAVTTMVRSENDLSCCFCHTGEPSHSCDMCKQPVHAIDMCSVQIDAAEGFGKPRRCLKCNGNSISPKRRAVANHELPKKVLKFGPATPKQASQSRYGRIITKKKIYTPTKSASHSQ